MTPDQYKRAIPFMKELEIVEEFLANIKKSSPQISIEWGGKTFFFNNFSSPDGNKNLNKAIEKELMEIQNSLLKHLEGIK